MSANPNPSEPVPSTQPPGESELRSPVGILVWLVVLLVGVIALAAFQP